MANSKTFVVQYLIKAREQFSDAADKTRVSAKKMREEVIKAKKEFADASATMRKARFTPPSLLSGSKVVQKMREEVGRLAKTPVTLKFSGAAKAGADRVRASLQRVREEAVRVNDTFLRLGPAMQKTGAVMSAAITAPVIAAAWSLKNAARDSEETRSKFGTVFSSISGDAASVAANLAANYGLSSTKSKQLLADTGDLLTGFGFTQDGALKMSEQVNRLAVDLASFTNYSGGAEGASAALTKALLGERESLKSLGIAISEENVNTKIKQMAAKGATFTSLRQAKAQATLALAYEQSKNAVGDFARTQQDLANQERITSARMQDLKEAFGRILLPVALKLTKAVRGVIESFLALSPGAKTTVLFIGAVAAAIGPLLLSLGSLAAMWPVLKVGAIKFALGATAAIGPLLPLIIGAAVAAALVIKHWDKVKAFFKGFSAGISEAFGPTMSNLLADFSALAATVAGMFGDDSPAAQSLESFTNLGQVMGEIIGGMLRTLINGLSGVGELLGQLIAAAVNLDFSQFDVEAIKAEFLGVQAQPATVQTNTNVGVTVGLDEGLRQTGAVTIEGSGARRADVGVN